MFFWLIINATFIAGSVDSIEENVALIEYKKNNEIEHEYVYINEEICIPYEGQVVLFNNLQVIACL